jgi:hypothetical protein
VHSTRSDKVYQLLTYGRWFFPGTPASATTKAGRHDIVEILLKVTLNTKNQIKSIQRSNLVVHMHQEFHPAIHHQQNWKCFY